MGLDGIDYDSDESYDSSEEEDEYDDMLGVGTSKSK